MLALAKALGEESTIWLTLLAPHLPDKPFGVGLSSLAPMAKQGQCRASPVAAKTPSRGRILHPIAVGTYDYCPLVLPQLCYCHVHYVSGLC